MFEDYIFALFERNHNKIKPLKNQKEESKAPKQEDSKHDESAQIADQPHDTMADGEAGEEPP